MKWVRVVIMWSLQTRIEKSYSYSISHSLSNLKLPIVSYHRCAWITRLTVFVPDYGSWLKILTHRQEDRWQNCKKWKELKQQQKQNTSYHFGRVTSRLRRRVIIKLKYRSTATKRLNTVKSTDKETTKQGNKPTNNHAAKKWVHIQTSEQKYANKQNKQTNNER